MKTNKNTLAFVESRITDIGDRIGSLLRLVDPQDEEYWLIQSLWHHAKDVAEKLKK